MMGTQQTKSVMTISVIRLAIASPVLASRDLHVDGSGTGVRPRMYQASLVRPMIVQRKIDYSDLPLM